MFVFLYVGSNKVFYLFLYSFFILVYFKYLHSDIFLNLLHCAETWQSFTPDVQILSRNVNAEVSRARTSGGRKYVRGARPRSFFLSS